MKNLVIIFLIIIGMLTISFGSSEDPLGNWTIGFMLICAASTLMQIQKPPAEPLRQTLTILTCSLCGLTKVRNYEQGDFVFKKIGNCDKCNKDSLTIKQIYSVRLKSPTEENKKLEELPKPEENREK